METGRRSMAATPHEALGFSDAAITTFPFTPIKGLSDRKDDQGDKLRRVVLEAWNTALEAGLKDEAGNFIEEEISMKYRDAVHHASRLFMNTAATILYLDKVWPFLQGEASAELSKKKKAGPGKGDQISRAVQSKFVGALDKWNAAGNRLETRDEPESMSACVVGNIFGAWKSGLLVTLRLFWKEAQVLDITQRVMPNRLHVWLLVKAHYTSDYTGDVLDGILHRPESIHPTLVYVVIDSNGEHGDSQLGKALLIYATGKKAGYRWGIFSLNIAITVMHSRAIFVVAHLETEQMDRNCSPPLKHILDIIRQTQAQ
ncbi:hypothetical protein VMCG_10794 [Cytospora schulzeri]|uniref:Uncharacterized protein n=1 Tax=Cytospora schulzeri TaxID=448051 RepID=A0A423VA39_9PEZI|nr:hypothetical protein VMCG_10794 [Valsa malicola]